MVYFGNFADLAVRPGGDRSRAAARRLRGLSAGFLAAEGCNIAAFAGPCDSGKPPRRGSASVTCLSNALETCSTSVAWSRGRARVVAAAALAALLPLATSEALAMSKGSSLPTRQTQRPRCARHVQTSLLAHVKHASVASGPLWGVIFGHAVACRPPKRAAAAAPLAAAALLSLGGVRRLCKCSLARVPDPTQPHPPSFVTRSAKTEHVG